MNRTSIEALCRADWIAALSFALARVPEAARREQIAHCFNLLTNGTLDASAIRIARSSAGEIVGSQVCVPLPGASALFWLPTAPDELAERLIHASLEACVTSGIKIAQVFVAPKDMPFVGPLLRQGFARITRMHQMQHSLNRSPSAAPLTLRFVNFHPTRHAEFAAVLQRTYEGTLDCPELNGKRTMEEIIAGHQSEGKFNPAFWWLAYHDTIPVGVLMLAELFDAHTWDLSYLGIVPEQRRQGFGRTMVQHAIESARAQQATRLLAAVDGRNTPALSLYRQAGFAESESFEVLLRFFGPSGSLE